MHAHCRSSIKKTQLFTRDGTAIKIECFVGTRSFGCLESWECFFFGGGGGGGEGGGSLKPHA